MTRLLAGLCAGVCLAACSPASTPEQPAATATAAAPAAPAASSAAPPAADKPLLNLTGDGLAVVDPKSGSSRPLPFGVAETTAREVVTAVRGMAISDGRNDECGAAALTFAEFPGGLTVWFQDGRFAGWALGDHATPDLATAAGLRVGSTRAELDSAYTAKVSRTTLGQEFQAGEISGVLSAPGAPGRVTALWAGVSCVFR